MAADSCRIFSPLFGMSGDQNMEPFTHRLTNRYSIFQTARNLSLLCLSMVTGNNLRIFKVDKNQYQSQGTKFNLPW